MKQSEILKIFKKTRALLSGHFLLSSGLHSTNYLQCALILQHPKIAGKLCKELAKKFKKEKPNVVIGPALGAINLSYEMARALDCRSLFAERENDKMVLRRNFSLSPEDKVLVVEDVLTTGGSVREVIEVVKSHGAKVVGIGCLVDRSQRTLVFGLPLKSLVKVNFKLYNPQDCPLCKETTALIKPGSRHANQRSIR